MKANVWFKDQVRELDYEVLAPGIYVYKNAIPASMEVIERVENALAMPGTRFKWEGAQVGYGDLIDEARRCQDYKLHPRDLQQYDEYSADLYKLHEEITDSLKMCLTHYNDACHVGRIDYIEAINVVKYGKGEYFKVHSDDGEPYRCTVSAVGYPNDNYAGGELRFEFFGVNYKPEAGDFVICPSAYIYAHASEPVLDDGIKYSLVIMTDRNEFAHRNDSPIYYPEEVRRDYGLI